MNNGVLDDSPQAIADFIHNTDALNWQSLGRYLQDRPDVLDCLVQLHRYSAMFLPDALRTFFSCIPAPNERGRFLENLLDRFSNRYIQCNRDTTMTKGKCHNMLAYRSGTVLTIFLQILCLWSVIH